MEYQIQRGDTLWALSRTYATTVDAIVEANASKITDPDVIEAGDTITIPEGAADAAAGAEQAQPGAAAPAAAPVAAAAQGATLPAPAAAAATVVPAPAAEPSTAVFVRAAAPPMPPGQPVSQALPARTQVAGRASYEDNAFEQRVVDLVNGIRSQYGLRQLTYDAALDRGAESHVAHQAAVGVMAHEGIGDGTPAERMAAVGWGRAWGENVAVGQTSPEQVVAEWMASPGHRANILNPNFSYLSVAYTVSSQGRPFWGQAFGA